MKILDFIFQNFWIWAGSMAALWIIVHYFVLLINIFLRFFILRKYGYPPEYCDVDGDFHQIKKIEIPDTSNE